ncbi:hypothetical protein SAMN04488554_3338 [Ruania alba]|uniref:Uncharacterized protein n=2 Tax=Ruania alba TaxID=648782 RepID=A0A1H5MEI5_9MICO|nr:hypothetical protein SAMN04488554_3338 [Ruania alba]
MSQQPPDQPNDPFAAPHQYGATAPDGATPQSAPLQAGPPQQAGAHQQARGPYGAPTGSAGSASSRNTAGRLALVFGLVCAGISTLAQLVWSFGPTSMYGTAFYDVFLIGYDIVVTITSLAACILGLIGLRRSNLPQRAAAIGLGLGLATFGPMVIYLFGRLVQSVFHLHY